MLVRFWPVALAVASLVLPVSVRAQVTEVEEAEVLRPAAGTNAVGDRPDLAQAVQSIIRQSNEFRQAEGLPTVELESKLAETAQYFAEYMARTDNYSHTADGNRPASRAKTHGYDYCIISENIAKQYHSTGFTTEKLAREFFEGWKYSPGHRKNMLDPDVTETGVAVARSEETGYYYAVQMFGRPKSQAIEFTITNQSEDTVEYKIGERSFTLPPRLIRTHERCRPSEVTFRWPGAEGEARIVQPSNEDRLVIRQEKGSFRLKKE